MSNKNNAYRKQVNPTELMERLNQPVEEPKTEDLPKEEVKEETAVAAVEATPVAAPAEEVKETPAVEEKTEDAAPAEPQKVESKKEAKAPQKTTVDGKEVYVNKVGGRRVVQKSLTDQPVAADVNDKVARLNVLLNKYVQIVSTKSPSEKTRLQFVAAFGDIAEYVLASDSYAVYNRFYEFFMKERNQLVAPQVALSGIHTIYNGIKRSNISAFYAVFQAMVRNKAEQKKFGLSIRAIRRALRNDKFCNWIQAKLNNRLA